MYRSVAAALILIALAGYFLFAMKREVEGLNFSLKAIRQEIRHEKINIKLLKAEFSHLTSNERLSMLAGDHLRLTNIKPERLMLDPLQEGRKVAVATATNKDRKLVRWRYKNKENYVIRASMRSR